MKVPSTGNFIISGGDSAFTTRQRKLFNQLSQAEKNCNKNQSSEVQLNDVELNAYCRYAPPAKHRRSETRQFRGKESIFKRAALPSPFADKGIPDYRRNPHKWMKYSLDDVQKDDMSDKTNTNVALSFLKELKARKSKDKSNNAMTMDVDCSNDNSSCLTASSSPAISTILFKKPLNKQKNRQSTDVIVDVNDKALFRGSKIILPEYVVGQKPVNKIMKVKQKIEKIDRHKHLKLNHLEDLDDDE